MAIKHDKITVILTGANSNRYTIIGKVLKATRKAKLSQTETNAFIKDAEKTSDTNELVKLICDTFVVA
jgi:hypothetical protein